MYSTCLFCAQDLGTNEVIEHFPIGRRLAFDASRGRLWVVCRKCERWNLTPLEERWEAIEEAERLFSQTRLRVSTDNVGLAKLREGLELVRIGSALRPEIAAWRYGDQFGRRRRRYQLVSVGAVAAIAGVAILGPATGIVAGGGWGIWQVGSTLHSLWDKRRVRLKVMVPGDDEVLVLRKNHLRHTALTKDEEGGWTLSLSYDPRGNRLSGAPSWRMREIRGDAAVRIAGQLLPKINASGATPRQVQDAVQLLERHGDPMKLFEYEARTVPLAPARRDGRVSRAAAIHRFPIENRLALEMAAHEEQERRAMEGELALLEAAWRQAEEIAKIADDMFLPDDAAARLEALKKEG